MTIVDELIRRAMSGDRVAEWELEPILREYANHHPDALIRYVAKLALDADAEDAP